MPRVSENQESQGSGVDRQRCQQNERMKLGEHEIGWSSRREGTLSVDC